MTLCDLKYQTMTRKVFQETIQACLDADKDKGPDVWLEVGSWDRMGMDGLDGDPDKSTLDALKTKRPIQVRSTDFHTVLTNSRGLEVAGITRQTPTPATANTCATAPATRTASARTAPPTPWPPWSRPPPMPRN